MIHYHRVPITPESDCARILKGRHAIVSFAYRLQLRTVADICQSFVLDNGAFTTWKRGHRYDPTEYYAWIDEWRGHPGFDWALIPDVIDCGEDANDDLLSDWPFCADPFVVPVWHLSESLDRLERLARSYSRIALGATGRYATIRSDLWWMRMAEAMEVMCTEGRPRVKLHDLRMLDAEVFTRFPFALADSTNVARNIGLDKRWPATCYQPANHAARGVVIADRIEAVNSAPRWNGQALQNALEFGETASLFDAVHP
jgi:hypothetical protein